MIRPDFVNHRMAGEPFKAYQARCRAVNKAIKLHLRGRLVHKASEPVALPLPGVNTEADRAVLSGHFRDVKLIHPPVSLPWPHGPRNPKPRGTQLRLGRTKGVTYRRYPEGRDRKEWRHVERQSVA